MRAKYRRAFLMWRFLDAVWDEEELLASVEEMAADLCRNTRCQVMKRQSGFLTRNG